MPIRSILLSVAFSALLPATSFSGSIGTTAPDFSVVDIDHKTATLSQFKGKVVFLNFWAPWCIACKDELPELDKMYKKYGEKGLIVVGINVDSSEADTVSFLKKNSLSFPVLIDAKGEVNDAYRIIGLPTLFVIGRDGVIRYQHQGYGSEFLPMFEKEITELLRQRLISKD